MQNGQNVPSRIEEPRDIGADIERPSATDALLVEPFHAFVPFEHHTAGGKARDGIVDILNGEIEDREGRRLMIRLGVAEDGAAPGR